MKYTVISLFMWQLGWWGGIVTTEYMNKSSILKYWKTDQLFTENYKCGVIK